MNTPSPAILSVVMPLFNEGAQIAANVEQTLAVLRMLGPFEMILVNDGSSDNSGDEIARLAKTFPDEVIPLHLPRSGKGEALRRGAQMARGKFVVFIDADLDLPPEQILFFIAIQRVKNADAVIGSKMHPDSTVNYPFKRRVYSLGYFYLVKLLFGLPVRDSESDWRVNGLQAMRQIDGLYVLPLDLTRRGRDDIAPLLEQIRTFIPDGAVVIDAGQEPNAVLGVRIGVITGNNLDSHVRTHDYLILNKTKQGGETKNVLGVVPFLSMAEIDLRMKTIIDGKGGVLFDHTRNGI